MRGREGVRMREEGKRGRRLNERTKGRERGSKEGRERESKGGRE